MFSIEIEETFAAAHQLIGYQGKCANLHGHNWRIQVGLESPEVDRHGLLMDFQELRDITRAVLAEFDHTFLNEHPSFRTVNTTAENLSRYIFERVAQKLPPGDVTLTHVRVHETDRYSATYRPGRPPASRE